MRWPRYIGIPWLPRGRTREGCDCWGLVRLAYREEWGLTLPSWSEAYEDPLDREATSKALRAGTTPEWTPVVAPVLGDVVLIRIGAHPCHVGMYCGAAGMVHQWFGRDSSVASLSSPQWSRRLAGYYRHAEAPCSGAPC